MLIFLLTINWRSYHGGKSSEQSEEAKSTGQVIKAEEVDEDDGGEGDVGRHKEPEQQGHDGETGVGSAEGEQEDGEGREDYSRVRDDKRVDPGEVGDPARDDSTESVGDADDWDEECGILYADIVLTNNSRVLVATL